MYKKNYSEKFCPKCDQHFFAHNDDGSCVDDSLLRDQRIEELENALKKIASLDPGLWKTAQKIARKALKWTEI